MNMITYLRVLVFCFMLYGYFSFIRRKFKIDICFVPIFVCSIIAVIVYFAGLLGIIAYVTYAIGLLGFLLGCYSIYLKKKNGMDIPDITMFHIGFAVGTTFFLTLLLGRKFIHYDNFTHWALVVKEMLITNAFPTPDSAMITFTNYPLGASSFIYFVCRLVAPEQGVMLFAQGIIVFSCFYGMFAIIEQKRRFLLTIFLATSLSILSFFNLTVRIDNLLVDFVLATITLAIFACIYTYRERLNELLLVSTPMIAFLLIIKNTGIFYACLIYLYIFYVCYKYQTTNTKHVIIYMGNNIVSRKDSTTLFIGKMALSISCAFSTLVLWNRHVQVLFSDVEHKFDNRVYLTFDLYADKSKEQVEQIVSLFLHTLFDFTIRASLGLLVFEVIGIAMCIIGLKFYRGKWKSVGVFVAVNISLLIYTSGILFMYILVMPYDEACYLAGFERYFATIVILALGILCMNMTINMEKSFHYKLGEVNDYKAFKSIKTKKYYSDSIIICILLLFFVLSSEYNGMSYNTVWYPDSIVGKVEELVGDSWEEADTETSYLLYASDEGEQVSSYYLEYVAEYYLYATNVKVISECGDDFEELLQEYDYFIVVEEDEEIREEMMELCQEDGAVGKYEIDEWRKL